MKLGIYEIGWDIRAAFQCLIEKVSRFRAPGKASAALGCSSKKFFKFIMVGQKARELIDQTQFFR